MKQEVIEKLYDNKPLSSEELVYVARNLGDSMPGIPYDHVNESVHTACGLEIGDGKKCAEMLEEALGEQANNKTFSEAVEKVEALCLRDPKLLRILIFHVLNSSKDKGIRIAGGEVDEETKDLILRLLKKKLGRNDQNDD